MIREFREFAIKGNVVDMAIGIMIGAAFTAVVNSLVGNVFTPVIGLLTGDLDLSQQFMVLRQGNPAGPYATFGQAEEAGAVVLGYGALVDALISFLLVAVALYLLVRWMNRLRRSDTPPAPTTRACPFCRTHVDRQASRCPNCTSHIDPVPTGL